MNFCENNIMFSYLKVIIGPMWSGKSSEVVRIYKHNCIARISTIVVNYADDKRYDEYLLSTHDKVKIPCHRYTRLSELLESGDLCEIKCIVIDEAQFFDDLYDSVKELLSRGKMVYVCGLDSDYEMKKFGQIIDVIPLADEVIKKQALCAICRNGKKAAFTKRLSDDHGQVVIGNDYIPVCRECHNKNI